MPNSNVAQAYASFKATFHQHFKGLDDDALDIVTAVTIAHYLPGKPVWLVILGPPGGAKTQFMELLPPKDRPPRSEFVSLSTFTPAALRGGLKSGHSLLKALDGKTLLTKDLAALSGLRSDVRRELLGLLRLAYDGEVNAFFGNEVGSFENKGQFGWLIASTNIAWEKQRAIEGELGPRFVSLHWETVNRPEAVLKSAENTGKMAAAEDPTREALWQVLDAAQEAAKLWESPFTELDHKWVSDLADLAATLRSPVARDRLHRLTSAPELEVGTRLVQAFIRIGWSLNLLELDYRGYLHRLVWDQLPSVRRKVLHTAFEHRVEILPDDKGKVDVFEGRLDDACIALATGLPLATVREETEALRLLGVNPNDVQQRLYISHLNGLWSGATAVEPAKGA